MRIHRSAVVSFLVVLLVTFPLVAGQDVTSNRLENGDVVPLRDWSVPFDSTWQIPAATNNFKIVANAVPSAPSHFITMLPCRIVDTRNANGPYGGPKLVGERTFDIDNGPCAGIPPNASAYSVSVSVTQTTVNGSFLTAWPTGSPRPLTATITWNEGLTLTTSAIIPAGTGGAINVYASKLTHLIIDINGYFAETVMPAATSETIRVTPSNLGIWEAWNDLCGTAILEFTNGESTTPPLGTGSFQVTAVDDLNGGALATGAYNGLLSSLSTLRYSTKSEDVTDHPYVYINLDDDGDSVRDRTIYFIPANNSQQGLSKANVWQTWDARNGKWNVGGDTGPVLAAPLSSLIMPGSTILGVRIASGCGPGTGGQPRARNTDDVEIGRNGNAPTIFDFERN